MAYTSALLILGWSGCVYFVGGKDDALKYLIGVIRENKFFRYSGRIRVQLYYQMLYNVFTEEYSI